MADYKYRQDTATEWQRCAAVVIMNPHQGVADIRMDEEKIVTIGDTFYSKPAGSLQFTFPPDEVINLRNPADGELTGQTMTCSDMYLALYSLYIQKALARDAE